MAFAEEIREYTQENTALREERDRNKVFVRFGQNIAGVVHNLRSVLTSVDGYIDLLRMGTDDDKERLLVLQRRSTRRMHEMIGNFMGAVRSYQREEHQRVSLNDLVRSSVEMLRGNPARTHRLKVETELSTPDVIVAAPMEAMQVIDNLVANASEAMQEGDGYLLVFRTIPDGDRVRLSILDEGGGISFCSGCVRNDCLRCPQFEFGKSTKEAGTGVGMMYVRQILRESDGGLEIESRPGEGTTVHVLFPMARP